MVERRDRAGVTTFHIDAPLAAGKSVSLPEAAAHHARVKRLAAGDPVQVTNGRGRIATGSIQRIARASIDVTLDEVRDVAPLPMLELYAPVGDRDRMLWLAEKATELGVTAWRPVVFQRSRSVSPRGEGASFAAKVQARMASALEQSGGAWLPVVHPEVDVARAAGECVIEPRFFLDQRGTRFPPADPGRGDIALILGPEGGVEPGERAQLVAAGWRPVAISGNILRFETAALAGVAVIRAAQVP